LSVRGAQRRAGEQPVSRIIPKLFTARRGEEVVQNKAFTFPKRVTGS
jgi:hypothetical protein